MNIIYAEYNIHHNSIDIATTAGYLLRIDCWKAEKGLKTTPCAEYALNALAIDDPLEYARLYLERNKSALIKQETERFLCLIIFLLFFFKPFFKLSLQDFFVRQV